MILVFIIPKKRGYFKLSSVITLNKDEIYIMSQGYFKVEDKTLKVISNYSNYDNGAVAKVSDVFYIVPMEEYKNKIEDVINTQLRKYKIFNTLKYLEWKMF